MNGLIRVVTGVLMATLMSGCNSKSFDEYRMEKADERPFESPLPINMRPKRMAIGNGFVIAVKEDGTVWSWGSGYYGELGTGSGDERRYIPKQIPGLQDVVEVAAGFHHVIALKRDGTAWGWGDNQYSQAVGVGPQHINEPRRVEGVSHVKRIAATANGSVFLTNEGDLYAMGENDGNPFPLESKVVKSPVKYAKVEDAVVLYAGVSCTGVIKKDGKTNSWGNHYLTKYHETELAKISVSDLQTVCYRSAVLSSDGFVYVATNSDSEFLGQGEIFKGGGFMKVKNLGRVVQITSDAGLALDEKGRIWQWGAGVLAQSDPGGRGVNRVPMPIVTFKLGNVIDLYTGITGSAAWTSDGAVYFWGSGSGGVRTREWPDRYPTKEEWVTAEKISWNWK